jgi:hypothetical protein
MDPVDLLRKVIRHRDPVRFVVLHDFVTEGGPGKVERRGHVCGLVVGDELSQHRDEHVYGVCGVPLLIGQTPAAKRVIRAVHLRAAVDQKQRGAGHE